MKIQDYFPEPISSAVLKLNMDKIYEIRLCTDSFVTVFSDRAYFLNKDGLSLSKGIVASADDIRKTIEKMSHCSLYSEQESIRQGFLPLQGGHRAGICGKAVMEGDRVRSIREIYSVNLRIAHEIKGAADDIMPLLKDLPNTLVISPPGCGKTTLLRDIARKLSEMGKRVGICDERGEIASVYKGRKTLDVGAFTDVFTGPKTCGAIMLLRSMAPEVIITDEIGGEEDALLIKKLVRCGVCVICSLHAKNLADARLSGIGMLLEDKTFERVIVLGRHGKIERIH